MKEELTSQTSRLNLSRLRINELTDQNKPIPYCVENLVQFKFKTPKTEESITSSYSNVSIKSKVINSSFHILSNAENSSNEWQNDIEPDYGDVNITTIITDGMRIFRLNFSENNETPASGITNTQFILESNPNPATNPTEISFDFRIPQLSSELLSSPHTLALEFRFNSSLITFILSDFEGNLGEILEDNITRPNGSDSLFILCNQTAHNLWYHISYNITRLITTYFTQEDYQKFFRLESVFCYMISFTPEYQLTLDIDNIDYFTVLPHAIPIIYSINETIYYANNGSLSYDSILGNFTFTACENSSWIFSQSYLEVNITRTKSYENLCLVKDWNETKIRINLNLEFSNILKGATSSILYINLPFDWINLSITNHSVKFEFNNQTKILNEYIWTKSYQLNICEMDNGLLEAWAPNYLSNIEAPKNICKNEVLSIRGDLRFPLPGYINLFFENDTFLFHQSTLSMINSTFIFTEILTEQFPEKILQLTLNWSNSWEFGIFKQIVFVLEESSQQAIIQFQSPQNIIIYQFESIFVNLSLMKDGEKYGTNSTSVFITKGDVCLFFKQTSNKDFILNVSHIVWDPREYILDVIASDGCLFFAQDSVNLTVEPAMIFWSFENLQSQLLRNENISFRLYAYIQSKGEGVFLCLSGLTIRIWYDDTVIYDCETNLNGYSDINFNFEYSSDSKLLQLAVGGILQGKMFKFQTLLFSISNETSRNSRERAYIHEIMSSPIIANETYYLYYNIEYSNNSSTWYVPLESICNVILSSYILRENYIIGVSVEDQMLTWNLEANLSIIDTLILEFPSPSVFMTLETISEKFRIKLMTYSEVTTSNFTIKIDLDFIGFPFSNVHLLDSLNRDITNNFQITIEGSVITISQLNIIKGIEIRYFLEGDLSEIKIELWKSMKQSYAYNESIIGSWKINTPINSSYFVQYSILGLGTWKCYNSSLEILPNASSIISATLPPQKWNYSISIQLNIIYSTDFIVSSSIQNITITDPYLPTLDYFLEPLNEFIRIHSYVYEPERASGIKNISLTMGDQNVLVSNFFSPNHYIFEISNKANGSKLIKIKTFDWAGNERKSEFSINEFISDNQSLSNLIESQFLYPTMLSTIIIGGILITRIIRKKRTSIL